MEARQPACAGLFYPGSADALRRELDRCFSASPAEPSAEPPLALIAPHAGYSYSGGIAARAYARVRGAGYELVVLLGPSHHVYFEGIRCASFPRWSSPLGDVAAADGESFRESFREAGPFMVDDEAHAEEHSLEVQLPFLQSVLQPGFRILPLLVGPLGNDESARALAELAGKRVLFVCSTDLSHDHPYARAKAMDGRLAELVADLDAARLYEEMRARRVEACGISALLLTLRLARLLGREKAEILALTNSGDVIGDTRSRIVGYLAASIS